MKIQDLLNKPTMTVGQLSKKYHTAPSAVETELSKGVKVEMEHTHNIQVAREIALDHLGEDLYYYEKLSKIEKPLAEALDQYSPVEDPTPSELKLLARRNKYHSARFVVYKPDREGATHWIAADSAHFTHHSMAPAMEAWLIRGYVQYLGDNEYAYRSMEVYSPKTVDHPLFRTWERAGIQDGNPEVVESHLMMESLINNDQGWGRVPNNQNVDYLGMRVSMKPSRFLKLAAPLERVDAHSLKGMVTHLNSGGTVASPWLVIRIPEAWEEGNYDQAAQVTSHEGRNRMYAIQDVQGDAPVEVHVFFASGLRARHIKPDWMRHMMHELIPQGHNTPQSDTWFTPIKQQVDEHLVAEAASVKLGPQLYVPHPKNLKEGLKPEAKLWTSTAHKSDAGYTSAWAEWCSHAMPAWLGHEGTLYDVKPGARILTLNTDRQARAIAKKYGVKITNVISLLTLMPWDRISQDYDAVHHVPSGDRLSNLLMGTWDVESTAWFNMNFLTNPRKVHISIQDPPLHEAWSKKYKKSINCSNPKGFSQRAHCAGRKARSSHRKTKSVSVSEATNPSNTSHDMDQLTTHHSELYDQILTILCDMIDYQSIHNPEKYGEVGAAIVDPDSRIVVGLSTASNGKWRHAEYTAIVAYNKKYGEIPPGSVIITTCSPCSARMPDRYGASCTHRINQQPIPLVYCGFEDPTQLTHLHNFKLVITQNTHIHDRCEIHAQRFMDWELEQQTQDHPDPHSQAAQKANQS